MKTLEQKRSRKVIEAAREVLTYMANIKGYKDPIVMECLMELSLKKLARASSRIVLNRDDFMRRYPRITAHIICESLGYATPSTAAMIGLDGMNRQENWCEWLHACYKCNAYQCLKDSIQRRHHHKGYMAEYQQAKALVERALSDGREPLFASWF